MSLENVTSMLSSMDICLKFLKIQQSDSEPLPPDVLEHAKNLTAQAKILEKLFDDIISSSEQLPSEFQHKFIVEKEIAELENKIQQRNIQIAKFKEKISDWDTRFKKLRDEQHLKLTSA
eukprot:TRINITY_DN3002_c0_g1_i1.p1 TRINITY_DN3002_c0_g1~~TRINITY_DN3002_c0_g1_i1.p1  ORF type:complete len:119 (-),score=26.51 TRINITY_DN3002_c0_g1_i1:50-406(-)